MTPRKTFTEGGTHQAWRSCDAERGWISRIWL